MVCQFILAILLVVGGAVGWVACGFKDFDITWRSIGSFCIFLLGVIGLIALDSDIKEKPKPIDVYRDRTTLQITYKIVDNDTVDIDSCVVWKPEFDPRTKET